MLHLGCLYIGSRGDLNTLNASSNLYVGVMIYSASSLERPFLWFMVNDYVLCHQIVTITVIRMKSGLDVPLSFFSMLRCFEVFEISNNKVIGA